MFEIVVLLIFTAIILGALWWVIHDGNKYNTDF